MIEWFICLFLFLFCLYLLCCFHLFLRSLCWDWLLLLLIFLYLRRFLWCFDLVLLYQLNLFVRNLLFLQLKLFFIQLIACISLADINVLEVMSSDGLLWCPWEETFCCCIFMAAPFVCGYTIKFIEVGKPFRVLHMPEMTENNILERNVLGVKPGVTVIELDHVETSFIGDECKFSLPWFFFLGMNHFLDLYFALEIAQIIQFDADVIILHKSSEIHETELPVNLNRPWYWFSGFNCQYLSQLKRVERADLVFWITYAAVGIFGQQGVNPRRLLSQESFQMVSSYFIRYFKKENKLISQWKSHCFCNLFEAFYKYFCSYLFGICPEE